MNEELGRETLAFLREAKAGVPPPPVSEQAEVWAGLASRLETMPETGLHGSSSLGPVLKWALVALGSTGAIASAMVGLVRAPSTDSTATMHVPAFEPSSVSSRVSDTAAVEPTAEVVDPTRVVDPEANGSEPATMTQSRRKSERVRSEAKDPVPPQTSVSEASSLATEMALMDQARTAMRAGAHVHAIALLRRHARAFPSGTLAAERSAVLAMALCADGQNAEGQAEQRRFLRTWPSSPLASSIRSACEPPNTGFGPHSSSDAAQSPGDD